MSATGVDQDDYHPKPSKRFPRDSYTNDPLPAVENTWHPQYIEVLTLKRIASYKSLMEEVVYQGNPAIAKTANFDWIMPRVENETYVYDLLDEYQRKHPGERRITPRFLGHLTENGRVMGMLLEKIDRHHASIQDLEGCKDAVLRLHEMGLIHGDVNRYNFLVEEESGQVKMVDFEHVEAFDETKAREEIESLATQLNEESRRGAPTVLTLYGV